jgi:murein DD-endopeptidase MepM/ murein hydrolase activator NlpD
MLRRRTQPRQLPLPLPPVRARYWLGRCGAPRFRYLTGALLCVAALALPAFVHKGQGPAPLPEVRAVSAPQAQAAAAPAAAAVDAPDAGQDRVLTLQAPDMDTAALAQALASVRAAVLGPEPRETAVTIESGDTLAGALEAAGLSPGQAYAAVQAATEHLDVRQIKPGQVVRARTLPPEQDGTPPRVLGAWVDMGPLRTVALEPGADADGPWRAAVDEVPVHTVERAARGKITTSLYGSAARDGVPDAVIARMIKILSWDVDFQRDIRTGDSFEVLYTARQTPDGQAAPGGGEVLYARLTLGGRDIRMYRFEDSDGVARYFGPDGKGARKALMRTPVDGARMSSGFGMRRHPILGYTKMHKGVDFAAPTGTPIYAAGDGVVERASRYGAYGNYIRIRHSGDLKTAYAHLSRYARGVAPGTRVAQGQVIGYVGSTGRSTGPHLHYEVIKNGTQVNPATVRQEVGGRLAGAELERFRAHTAGLNARYAALRDAQGPTRVAQGDDRTR